MNRGRPTIFTPELDDSILEMLASGLSLRAICKDPQMPADSTVRLRVLRDEAFSARYARARNIGLDCLADRMMEIAEQPIMAEIRVQKESGGIEITTKDAVDRSRLAVDAIKWQLSKMRPEKYGDRLQVAGDAEAPVQMQVTLTRPAKK